MGQRKKFAERTRHLRQNPHYFSFLAQIEYTLRDAYGIIEETIESMDNDVHQNKESFEGYKEDLLMVIEKLRCTPYEGTPEAFVHSKLSQSVTSCRTYAQMHEIAGRLRDDIDIKLVEIKNIASEALEVLEPSEMAAEIRMTEPTTLSFANRVEYGGVVMGAQRVESR